MVIADRPCAAKRERGTAAVNLFLLMTVEKAINNQMLFCQQRVRYLSFIIESSLAHAFALRAGLILYIHNVSLYAAWCISIMFTNLFTFIAASALCLCFDLSRAFELVFQDFNQQFVQIISVCVRINQVRSRNM